MLQMLELGAAMAFALSFVLCEGKPLANRRELINSNYSMPTNPFLVGFPFSIVNHYFMDTC